MMSKVQEYLRNQKIKELGLPTIWVVQSDRTGVSKPVEMQVVEIKGNTHFLDNFPHQVRFSEGETSYKEEGYGTGFGDLWGWTCYSCLSKENAETYYEQELERVTNKYLKYSGGTTTKNKLNAIDFRFFIGCPCYITDSNPFVFSTIEGIDSSTNTIISERVNYSPDLIKPILRKFDSLSRHEIEELNKLWPKEKINRTTFGSIQLDAEIIDYLTSLHVDVFGWIELGLAIDPS
jgi:hypothetical protein